MNAPSQPDVASDETLQIFQSRREEITNKARDPSLNCTESSSMVRQSLVQSNERTSKSMENISKAIKNAETMTEKCSNSRKISTVSIQGDSMTELLGGLYKKFEDIEQSNSTRLGKIENEIDARFKEHNIAFQELRRRYERLENKTDAKSVQRLAKNYSDLTNTSSLDIQIGKLAELLKGLYQKLEEMEKSNATQFRNIIDNSKETDRCLKHVKAQEEATKIELHGVRRRMDSFEKKPY